MTGDTGRGAARAAAEFAASFIDTLQNNQPNIFLNSDVANISNMVKQIQLPNSDASHSFSSSSTHTHSNINTFNTNNTSATTTTTNNNNSNNKNNSNNNNHFIQLAGGTNNYSLNYSIEYDLPRQPCFGGYAYGGYARKHINSILENLDKTLSFSTSTATSTTSSTTNINSNNNDNNNNSNSNNRNNINSNSSATFSTTINVALTDSNINTIDTNVLKAVNALTQGSTRCNILLIEDFPAEFQLCMEFIDRLVRPVKTYDSHLASSSSSSSFAS
jgi:hypothetical protein